MAFNGYYLKINGTIFPNEFIVVESFVADPEQTLQDDAYTDGDGYLHISDLPHTRTKIEFNTPDKFSEAQNEVLRTYLTDMRNATVEYWNPKRGTYRTGIFYISDISYTIKYQIGDMIYYNPIRIALIEK
jgi:hypothetical protein